MDFNDTTEEAAFRAEARAWLEKTLKRQETRNAVRIDGEEGLKGAKAYQAKKAAAGYVGLTWKKEVVAVVAAASADPFTAEVFWTVWSSPSRLHPEEQ